MKTFLFASAVVLELFYVLMFLLTLRRPGFRFWPPPSPRSWQFFVSWLAAGLVVLAFAFLGLLDFNSFFVHSWLRFPVAGLCFVLGAGLGMWSFNTLGLQTMIGLGERLVTGGPYSYSRNPQYVGDSLNTIGYMILTNSWMAWVVGLLGVLLNLLAPFLEEPWLEEKFGETYIAYKKRVPHLPIDPSPAPFFVARLGEV